jgi:hypothetical protein
VAPVPDATRESVVAGADALDATEVVGSALASTEPVLDALAAQPVTGEASDTDAASAETTDEAGEPAAESVSADSESEVVPDVVIAAQTEHGNVNVSVRVDSPGHDGPVTQSGTVGGEDQIAQNAPPAAVISAAEHGDTTTTDVVPGDSPQQKTVSSNVSVRAQSPGDNGPVEQRNTPPETPDRDGAISTPTTSQQDQQYHDDNSQYHESKDTHKDTHEEDLSETWNWTWRLTICDEDVHSISSQVGDMSARIWTWDWDWNWTCDGAEELDGPASAADASDDTTDARRGTSSERERAAAPSPSDAANVNVSIRAASPGDNGPVSQANAWPTPSAGSDDAGEAPWIWAWTFGGCGPTTEIVSELGAGAGLVWTWSWVWDRPCAAESASPGDTTRDTTPGQNPGTTHPSDSGTSASDTSTSTTAATGTALAIVENPTPIAFESVVSLIPTPAIVVRLPALDPALPGFEYVIGEDETQDDSQVSWLIRDPARVETATGREDDEWSAAVVIVFRHTGGTPVPRDPAPPTPAVRMSASVERPQAPDVGARRAAWPPAVANGAPSGSPATGAGIGVPGGRRAGAAPVARPGAGPAPRERSRRDMPSPLGGLPVQTGVAGSPASAGGNASGSGVGVVALLVGLFVFAAPGHGRLMRLARTPRPRSRYGRRIDRPG